MFAQRTKELIRSYDIFGRLGGEEFLIISPGSNLFDSLQLAERVREHIGTLVVPGPTETIAVTVSLGVTALNTGDSSIDTLMRRADAGLYKAKSEGRNRVGSVDPVTSS